MLATIVAINGVRRSRTPRRAPVAASAEQHGGDGEVPRWPGRSRRILRPRPSSTGLAARTPLEIARECAQADPEAQCEPQAAGRQTRARCVHRQPRGAGTPRLCCRRREDAQADRGAEDHRRCRQPTELRRAQMADDRCVCQHHHAVRRSGAKKAGTATRMICRSTSREVDKAWPSSMVIVYASAPSLTAGFVDKYMNRRPWMKISSKVFCLHTVRGIAAGQSGAAGAGAFFSTPSSTDCAHGRTAFSPGCAWLCTPLWTPGYRPPTHRPTVASRRKTVGWGA